MEMFNCVACGEKMSEGANCISCGQLHFHCAGITETGYRKLGDRKLAWRCGKCRRGDPSQPSSPLPHSESLLLKEIHAIALKLAPLETLRDDFLVLRKEFTTLTTSLSDTNKALNEFGAKFECIEQRLAQMEKTQSRVDLIQSRLDRLEHEANASEQWSRMNNAELKGIPESAKENLFDLLSKVSSHIKYPVNKSQINFISRVPTREKGNPKPIIISFCNRYVKEDFVAAARHTFRGAPLTSHSLGLTGHNRVYVNDHLTVQNKSLLAKTKKAASENNFQYVWIKHSKIHVRKSDTSHVIIVHSDKDILKIV